MTDRCDMNDQKIYYKVVKHQDGILTSILIRGELCITYVVGEKTVAPVGGIFVFKTKEDAVKFAVGRAIFSPRIYTCLGEKSMLLPDCCDPTITYISQAADYWKYSTTTSIDWPKGTLAFKYVTLLEDCNIHFHPFLAD